MLKNKLFRVVAALLIGSSCQEKEESLTQFEENLIPYDECGYQRLGNVCSLSYDSTVYDIDTLDGCYLKNKPQLLIVGKGTIFKDFYVHHEEKFDIVSLDTVPGWHTVNYDVISSGGKLYSGCQTICSEISHRQILIPLSRLDSAENYNVTVYAKCGTIAMYRSIAR